MIRRPVDPGIPTWLQARIQEDEATIALDSTLPPNYGAWLRYQFEGEYYVEYDNPLSSSICNPRSWEGVPIDFTAPAYTKYREKRAANSTCGKLRST